MSATFLACAPPAEGVVDVGAVLEALPSAALLCSPEGKVLAANAAARAFLGGEPELLKGRRLGDVFPTFDRKHILAAGGSWLPQLAVAAGDRKHWCLTRFQPLAGGGFLVFVEGESSQSEPTARIVKDQYQKMFAQAHVGFAILHPLTGHILKCNKHLAMALGVSETELVGQRFVQLLHGDDRDAYQALWQSVWEGRRESYQLECLAYRRDGTLAVLGLVASPVRDEDGRLLSVFLTVTDLTLQRREESRLHAAKEKYRLLFKHSLSGLLRFDTDGHLLECNEAFARMLGFGYPAQVLVLPLSTLLPSATECEGFLAELKELVRLPPKEVRLRCRDGRILWALVTATLMPDAVGALSVAYGSFLDITERRNALRMLHIQHELARQLAVASTLAEALPICLRAALEASELDAGGIYLASADGGLDLAYFEGLSAAFIGRVARIPPDSHRLRALAAGTAAFFSLAHLPSESRADWAEEGLRSAVALPIRHEGRLVGCFNLASHTLDDIPPSARTILETIAPEVGNVILRMRADSIIREREKELTTLFNSLPGPVFVVDPEGTLLDANHSACLCLGYDREQLLGHPLPIRPQAGKGVQQLLAPAFVGDVASFQVVLVAADGRQLVADIAVSPGKWGEKPVLFCLVRHTAPAPHNAAKGSRRERKSSLSTTRQSP